MLLNTILLPPPPVKYIDLLAPSLFGIYFNRGWIQKRLVWGDAL